jgi:hypothetical protein
MTALCREGSTSLATRGEIQDVFRFTIPSDIIALRILDSLEPVLRLRIESERPNS